jgi:hypothetical protein
VGCVLTESGEGLSQIHWVFGQGSSSTGFGAYCFL